jgi:hypothetical protein
MNILGALFLTMFIVLLIIGGYKLCFYYFNKEQSKKYFIGDIAVNAYHDDELLDMRVKERVFRSYQPLTEEDMQQVDKELLRRGILFKD